MTDTPQEPSKWEPVELGSQFGMPVVETTLILRQTGTGFADTMKTDPVLLEPGDSGVLIIEYEVDEVRYDRIKEKGEPTGDLTRVHVADAGIVVVAERESVAGHLEAQTQRTELRKEHEDGVLRLDRELEESRANLAGDHVLGEHAEERMDGCPRCEDELRAMEEEAGIGGAEPADTATA